MDTLPNELLFKIIYYAWIPGSEKRNQCHNVCKRWRIISEEYLLKTLKCYGRQYKHRLNYFEQHPSKGRLVKTLRFDRELKARHTLDDAFFQLFPNVSHISTKATQVNWKLFSQVFNSDRCRLRRLPAVECLFLNDIKYYHTMALDHCQSLERLVVSDASGRENYYSMKLVSNLSLFKSLKDLELSVQFIPTLEFDSILNQCPLLTRIAVSLRDKEARQQFNSYPWAGIVKRIQRPIKYIKISLESSKAFAFYPYIVTKFMHVKHWEIAQGNVDGELVPVLVRFLPQLIRSATHRLSFTVSRIPVALLHSMIAPFYSAFPNIPIRIHVTNDYSTQQAMREDNSSSNSNASFSIQHRRLHKSCWNQELQLYTQEMIDIYILLREPQSTCYIDILQSMGSLIKHLELSLVIHPSLQQHQDKLSLHQILIYCPNLKTVNYEIK